MSRETSRGTVPVRLLCETFHLSRQAYYAALQGPAAPAAERPRRERQGDWATAAELEAGVRRVVKDYPGWGVRKVWAYLRREGVRASHKRVWAMMNALGLVLPPARERDPDAPRGQVVAATSDRRWATDLTTTWTKQDGVVAIVPVVDCGDRVALACEVTKSQESPAVLAPTERALRTTFGDPVNVPDGLELRSDHGPQFTGDDCEKLTKAWHLDHTLAPVGRPTGNAVAERFIQTLKVELLWTRDWDSIEELRVAVAAWLHVYNTKRPHQALGWQTPAERRAQNLASARADAA
jgi:transposase InsO family protein